MFSRSNCSSIYTHAYVSKRQHTSAVHTFMRSYGTSYVHIHPPVHAHMSTTHLDFHLIVGNDRLSFAIFELQNDFRSLECPLNVSNTESNTAVFTRHKISLIPPACMRVCGVFVCVFVCVRAQRVYYACTCMMYACKLPHESTVLVCS